jgi:decaprenylphospho-beta-D-erythro-pentofuranosid-2-ulose 2-reductase
MPATNASQRILIIGATSAIAQAAAREWAARGETLFLAGRDTQALQAIATDLLIRGAAGAATAPFDALDIDALPRLIDVAVRELGGLDLALVAHGVLPDRDTSEVSVATLRDNFSTNALSVIVLSALLGQRFAAQGHGVLAAISSVAGERGRRSNYEYGAAKSAVTTFLSGLRQALYARGVRVITIKPGFVSTPMTAGFRKGPLWASPARVARDIVHAMDRGTPVLYTPWFWRPIMALVRFVPERLFLRLRT